MGSEPQSSHPLTTPPIGQYLRLCTIIRSGETLRVEPISCSVTFQDKGVSLFLTAPNIKHLPLLPCATLLRGRDWQATILGAKTVAVKTIWDPHQFTIILYLGVVLCTNIINSNKLMSFQEWGIWTSTIRS